MKRSIMLLLMLSVPLGAENVDTTFSEVEVSSVAPMAPMPVRIVHPREGASLPSVSRSFVYGWADPGGILTVNGAAVAVHPGGGWVAMTDYDPGPNTIRVSYEKAGVTVSLNRKVTVGGGGGGSAAPESTLRPAEDVGAAPGELVPVSFRGSEGGAAYFTVHGMKGKFPMAELNGNYRGFFTAPGAPLKKAAVKVHFKSKSGKGFVKEAPGRVTTVLPEAPWVVEVSTDVAALRAGPGFSEKDTAGYVMFPAPGARLVVTGFKGDEFRVRLTKERELWIPRKEVRELPAGTPPPLAVTHGLHVRQNGRHALVRMSISQKVPFEVTPSDDLRRIDVRFFGAYSNTDWIHPNAAVPWVREIRWFQDASDVFRFTVETDPDAWWGYDARYENGSFTLELRRPPPAPADRRASPLEGLLVAVDAGHSDDIGAVGVTGIYEKDYTLLIAECLKKKLEAEKARVVMVREGKSHVPLFERPRIAWASEADALISVHLNALPEGENPFDKNGFGMYYYHPHSLALAEEVQEAYRRSFLTGKNVSKAVMRDDGVHWGNLALPRTPQMPAILTESAYLIHPQEEFWIRQPEFQCDCAEAMKEGLKSYVRKMRPPK